jgi:hypothetical protein
MLVKFELSNCIVMAKFGFFFFIIDSGDEISGVGSGTSLAPTSLMAGMVAVEFRSWYCPDLV